MVYLNSRSQLLKGVLEGCILAIMKQEPTYGYGLSVKLHDFGLTNISEGSIYPILLRLQKEQLIVGEIRDSPSGPKRKYYQLTEAGEAALTKFTENWETIKTPVDQILQGGNES